MIWSLTRRTIEAGLTRPRTGEGSRLAAVLADFVRDVHSHPGMSRFLAEEGEFAMRLLTMRSGGYQQRLIALVHDLVVEDTAAGRLASPVPADDLAYTVVRIVESYVYRSVITGEEPDADRAVRVLEALLPPTR